MITNDDNYKEVRFDKYCKKCEHRDLEEWQAPCIECMAQGMNLGSEKPVMFKGVE